MSSSPGRTDPAVRPTTRRNLRRNRRRPAVDNRANQRKFGVARFVSLALILVIGGIATFIFTHPMFYVRRIEIGGLNYITAEEIFSRSGIAGFHVLWVEPDVIESRIEESTSIESVDVVVRWPSRILIFVQEREPSLVWIEDGSEYWVDVNGNLMIKRGDAANVVRVINEGETIPFRCPGPGCDDEDTISIDPDVVSGAQQLKTLRANIDILYYSQPQGLSFDDDRGWRAYFGSGLDMDTKLIVYERIVADLLADGEDITYVDVSNPEAPYYGTR